MDIMGPPMPDRSSSDGKHCEIEPDTNVSNSNTMLLMLELWNSLCVIF